MKKLLIIIGVIVVLYFIGSASFSNENTNTQIEQSTNEQPKSETIVDTIATDPLESLSGFIFYNRTDVAEDDVIYSYNPFDVSMRDEISVTVDVTKSQLNIHDQSFTLDKEERVIQGIPVMVGYQEEDYFGDTLLFSAHEKVAFDFEYDGMYYSGEISNLLGESDKARLDEVLEQYVSSISSI